MGQPHFEVFEATFLSELLITNSHLGNIHSPPENITNKDLKYYFSYYGGTRSTLEQDLLTALVATRQHLGNVDYIGNFKTDAVKFNNYLETATHFVNRELADQLINVRNNFKVPEDPEKYRSERFDYSGPQWKTDRVSACQILRETNTADIIYNVVTEKTARCFIHFQIPIPLSGVNCVRNLEKLGFRFCHDLIDYSYQNRSSLIDRTLLALDQVDKLAMKYSLDDLKQYIIYNKDMFWHNYNLLASGSLFNQIKTDLLNKAYK